VEIDPTLDVRDMTSRMGAHVLLAFLQGKKKSGRI
jgi:formiminoglutamase